MKSSEIKYRQTRVNTAEGIWTKAKRDIWKSKGSKKKKAKSCNKSKQTKVWSLQSKRQNDKKGSSYPILKFIVKFILYNTTVSRTSKSLPRSSFKKTQVISQLVSSLSPKSKGQVFAISQRRIGTCLGRPSISTEKRNTVKSFLHANRAEGALFIMGKINKEKRSINRNTIFCRASKKLYKCSKLNMTLKSHTIPFSNL